MYGKLLGAGIGACLAMLVDAPLWVVAIAGVVGLGLGHVFGDQPFERKPRPRAVADLLAEGRARRGSTADPSRAPNADQAALIAALCPLFIEVARADGVVVSDEVRRVREFFEGPLGFDDVALEGVRLALKQSIAQPATELDALVKLHRSAIKPQLRVEALRAMYDVALADGPMRRAEQDVLRRIVQHFNLADEQLREVTREFFGSGEAHYQALGLTEAATDDEVRSAFRRLAAEHHPDRVAAQGAAAVEQAATRFRQLKDAYEALKQLRGL